MNFISKCFSHSSSSRFLV